MKPFQDMNLHLIRIILDFFLPLDKKKWNIPLKVLFDKQNVLFNGS